MARQRKLFSRRLQLPERDPHSYASMVASATRLDVKNRAQTRQMRQYKQGWQSDAWAMRDAVGELRYASEFLAMCAARMRLYPAVYSKGAETDVPIPMREAKPGVVPSELPDASEQLLSMLGHGQYATSNVMQHLSTQWTIPGEAFLLGREEDGEETWTIRSNDEIVIQNDKYYLRELPTDPQGVKSWEELDEENIVLTRMWSPHPRFRLLADSPLRAILEECESLLIHRRGIRAIGRSRIAGRGLLLIPEELSLKVPNEDNEDPESDPFFSSLAQIMQAPIADEGVASAVTPAVIRGPAEFLKAVQHIDLAAKFDETSAKIREELIGVIASGLDLPKEIIMGVADLNHWSAWQVEDNTFRHHIEPHIEELCEALTNSYFRPALEDMGYSKEEARRYLIWYDPSELVTHPDQTKDALDLYDRDAISPSALRRTAGFAEADAPLPVERLIRLLSNMRTPPANVVMAAVHAMDPTMEIPPIDTSGTVPGVDAAGVDPAKPPAEATTSALPAPVADTPPPAEGSRGSEEPPAPPASVASGASRSHPRLERMSQRLMMADRDLRTQLQVAASDAVMRQLERAGAKLRSKVAKDETLRAKIAHKRNDRVSAYLGQELVASLGVQPSELVTTDWDQLRSQFLETVAASQKRVVGILKSEGMRAEVADKLLARMKAGRQPGWEYLAKRLTELTHDHLYAPDPNKTVREWGQINPHTIVPAGVVRQALSIAGGKEPTQALTAAEGIEGGGVYVPAGQLGGGEAVEDALGEEGIEATGFRWVHGPSIKPFEPHLELDGQEFEGFTDAALANSTGWPDREFFMPGDHEGCMCDFEQTYEQAESTQEEGAEEPPEGGILEALGMVTSAEVGDDFAAGPADVEGLEEEAAAPTPPAPAPASGHEPIPHRRR